jgi:hypothetical protein
VNPRIARRPGENLPRLARLIRESIDRTELDLRRLHVLTEAASGPYVVTPVIAAAAGAEVVALTADSDFGSASCIREATMQLAGLLDVADRIVVTQEKTVEQFAAADVITNSGHVRPITGVFAGAIRPDAVVPLMFETWEIGAGRTDVDLGLMRSRQVGFAGTNERHPAVDVFSYLGPMAVAQLADAGVAAYHGTIAVLCDNPFAHYIIRGLRDAGATVLVADDVAQVLTLTGLDAVIVAMTPTGSSVLTARELAAIADGFPGVVLCQFWGDVDRTACRTLDLDVWPQTDPGPGHMGVLPSRVGPEPIVRLQTGGLKVAQILRMPLAKRTDADRAWLDA